MKVRDQSHIITIKSSVQNVQATFFASNMLLKLFAINLNGRGETISKSHAIYRFVTVTVIMGSINFYTLFYKIFNVYEQINPSIKITDAIQMIYDFLQHIVDLYFVYKYGRDMSVEYFKNYENIDKILGAAYYSTLKVKLVKSVAVILFMWLISSTCDFSAWVVSFGWMIPLMYAISYFYLLLKILSTLDLSAHVMNIGSRLSSLCENLQEWYRRLELVPGATVDYIYNEHWLYSNNCSNELQLQMKYDPHKMPYNIKRDIKTLSRCYLMIIEQASFINEMYGIRILLNMLSFLIDMIRFTNLIVKMILGSQHTAYDSGYFPAVSSTMRLVTVVSVIVNFVYHCEQVYRECDKILNIIDHMLFNKKLDDHLREDVTELQGFIKSRPIRFNMANFFTLNYSLLVSLASVVVTYSIIILQSLN